MIKEVSKSELKECANVIRESFLTVADEFGITKQNAARYVAFSTTSEKLLKQYKSGRKMFAYYEKNKIVGFYSVDFFSKECELNNICVLPEYRHKKIGRQLLEHAVSVAKSNFAESIKISIVEENVVLRNWYTSFGFEATHTEKFDFFPFTCGYYKMDLHCK